MTLISVPSPANIKSICDVLRIGVGPIIELENQDTEALRPLLEELQKYTTNRHVQKLLNLRNTGWFDYLPCDHPDMPKCPYSIEGCELEPVYFNKAGVPYLAASTADPYVCRELFY